MYAFSVLYKTSNVCVLAQSLYLQPKTINKKLIRFPLWQRCNILFDLSSRHVQSCQCQCSAPFLKTVTGLNILFCQLCFLDRFVYLHLQFCHHALRRSLSYRPTCFLILRRYANLNANVLGVVSHSCVCISLSRSKTLMPASVSWQPKESTSRVCLQRVSW